MEAERTHEHQWSDWETNQIWSSEGIFIERRRRCQVCGALQIESLG